MVGDADASVVADAPQPPVPDSLKRELERRGLRPPSGTSAPKSTSPPPRSRDEQLRELERQIAEEEAEKANSAKSGEASA